MSSVHQTFDSDQVTCNFPWKFSTKQASNGITKISFQSPTFYCSLTPLPGDSNKHSAGSGPTEGGEQFVWAELARPQVVKVQVFACLG